jgi:DNA-binding MarR family transcriptional regulator
VADGTTRADDAVEEAVRQWSERYPHGPGFRVLTGILRAYNVAVRGVEQILRTHGLNLSRYEVLLLLSFTRRGQLPMMKIRDLLMVHGSSITYIVDRLAEAGLVERRSDPDDGRVWLVAITHAGRALVERASRSLHEHEFGLLGDLDEDEQATLGDLLAHLRTEPSGRTADGAAVSP